MDSEKIFQAFSQCAGLEGSELAQELESICGDDREFRNELEKILAADQSNNQDFMDWVSASVTAPLVSDSAQVGDYCIVRRIGAGSFGQVYLARSSTGRTVALKFLLPWVIGPRSLVRFQREASVLSRVEHPKRSPVDRNWSL